MSFYFNPMVTRWRDRGVCCEKLITFGKLFLLLIKFFVQLFIPQMILAFWIIPIFFLNIYHTPIYSKLTFVLSNCRQRPMLTVPVTAISTRSPRHTGQDTAVMMLWTNLRITPRGAMLVTRKARRAAGLMPLRPDPRVTIYLPCMASRTLLWGKSM